METIASLAHDFLSQPSIAVVGISSSHQTVANGIYKKLRSGKRTLFAVGKHSTAFEGDHCYPGLTSIPVPVGGVFIAASQENIDHVVDECIALHIPRLWIHHMGGTTNSGVISPSVRQRCRDHSITLIPGACPMMFVEDSDFGHRCIRWVLNAAGKLRTEA
ncbi:MAG: CoA-binding protein [Bacteroidota bacterium]|jgi:hypothetical protein